MPEITGAVKDELSSIILYLEELCPEYAEIVRNAKEYIQKLENHLKEE